MKFQKKVKDSFSAQNKRTERNAADKIHFPVRGQVQSVDRHQRAF